MNKQELIEEIEELKDLEKLFGNNPNYIEIDTVIRLISKLDEPQPLKLKDVIKRIECLNLGTQKIWLDEILNELGSDYGTLKYKDGYGQGKLEGEWVGQLLKDADKIRLELNKPVVPQFVADWYEKHKDSLEFNIFDYVYRFDQNAGFDFKDWFDGLNTKPFQTLINMHQFGYTVEEEKRYRVKMKNAYYNKYPQFLCETDNGIFWAAEKDLRKTKFTRKELEQASFSWVFDCPGIEIEEVTE